MEDTVIKTNELIKELSEKCIANGSIDKDLYDKYHVKRGLRDKQGNGVVTGLTSISEIEAYQMNEAGEKVPCEGKLLYRGYNIYDLVGGDVRAKRLGLRKRHIYYCLMNCPMSSSCMSSVRCWAE